MQVMQEMMVRDAAARLVVESETEEGKRDGRGEGAEGCCESAVVVVVLGGESLGGRQCAAHQAALPVSESSGSEADTSQLMRMHNRRERAETVGSKGQV